MENIGKNTPTTDSWMDDLNTQCSLPTIVGGGIKSVI